MPIINPDKSYVQTPLRIKVTEGIVIPEDWLTKLGNLVADDILKLPAQEKTIFLDKLKEKAGSDSTYTLKTQLLESLKVIYATLASPTTPASQKTAAAVKLREGAPHCTPGFHDRTNEIVISFSTPESLDELLTVQRQAIVSRAASQMTDEIHAHNRFYVVARNAGYGVRPLNPNDMYRGKISDAVITTKLTEVFSAHFTVFNVLNSLQEQLNDLVCNRGYSSRRDAGYEFADYQKFDNEFLKPFISMAAEELFLSQEDQSLIPKVLDINWWNVKQALLRNIRNERYFIFSAEEEALLDVMTRDGLSFDTLPPAAISLFPSPDELLRALMFFKEWPVEKKAGLVLYYFKHKPQQDQKAVLDKLEKVPALNAQLHVLPAMQNIYFSHAVAEGNLDKVQELVRHRPESINSILGLFIGKQKAAVMAWLDSDPSLRAVISQDALNTLITEGVHKGKTVADVWITSKKGRQSLLADKRLQGLCPPVLAGKPLADWMQQAQAERNNISMIGLFPAINPRVMQFLQHVVQGEQAQAEAMLKNNPLLAAELLTTKGKVKDYSKRKIMGTALQIALGAEDVRYHDNEECMAEMLERYLRQLPNGEQIIAAQIHEQFPAGWEAAEIARAKRDDEELKKVFAAIRASGEGDNCEAAIKAFTDYLEKENKGRGIIKTGKHFNHGLLLSAFVLYDDNYNDFGGWDSRRNNLAWRKIIGGIQRYVPAATAQAICQGVYYIVEQDEKLERKLTFRYSDVPGAVYYPLDGNLSFRLGEECAAWRDGSPAMCLRGASWVVLTFTKLCRAKSINVAGLMPRVDNPAKNR